MKKQVNRIDWLNSQLAEAQSYVDRYEQKLADRPNSTGLKVALASWISQKEEIEELLLVEIEQIERGTIELDVITSNHDTEVIDDDITEIYNSIRDMLNSLIFEHKKELELAGPNKGLRTDDKDKHQLDYFERETGKEPKALLFKEQDVGINSTVYEDSVAAFMRMLYAETYQDLAGSVALNGIGIAKQYALLLNHLALKGLGMKIKWIAINSRNLNWSGSIDRIKIACNLFESLNGIKIREIIARGHLDNRSLSSIALFDPHTKKSVEIFCSQIQRTMLLNVGKKDQYEISAVEYSITEKSGKETKSIGGVSKFSIIEQ